jgi:hypothetical protein
VKNTTAQNVAQNVQQSALRMPSMDFVLLNVRSTPEIQTAAPPSARLNVQTKDEGRAQPPELESAAISRDVVQTTTMCFLEQFLSREMEMITEADISMIMKILFFIKCAIVGSGIYTYLPSCIVYCKESEI